MYITTVFNIHPLSVVLPLLPFQVFELVLFSYLSIAFLPSSVFGSSVFFFQKFDLCDKIFSTFCCFFYTFHVICESLTRKPENSKRAGMKFVAAGRGGSGGGGEEV